MTTVELFAGALDRAEHMVDQMTRRLEGDNCGTRWAGDVRSAALERLWRCAVAYDASREAPFDHYWPQAVRGAMVDELRRLHVGTRRAPRDCLMLEEQDDRPTDDPTPEDVAVAHAVLEEMDAAVAALPPDLRVVMAGCREGVTQRAIAIAEGVTDGAITLRKRRARRILVGQLAAVR